MPKDYKWREIEDLPEDVRSLTNNELRPLHRIWMERKDSLTDLEEFHQRLKREWAIETGIIEGVYVFDRGVTTSLIEHGINPSLIPRRQPGRLTPEHVAMIIDDHTEVLDWLFDFIKGDRRLTTSYIKELHAGLLRHQDTTIAMTPVGEKIEVPLVRGVYKNLPNNPTIFDGVMHEYCPPEHVASEMDRLIQWHEEHLRREIPPEVEAAWLHHRFTQIHPFQDGNGRVARAIASLIFIRANWFPLVVRSDEKAKYLDALGKADFGNLELLVSWFSGVQTRLLVIAIDSAVLMKAPADIDEAVASTRRSLVGTGRIVPGKWKKTRAIAQDLCIRAATLLDDVAEKLRDGVPSERPVLLFTVVRNRRDDEVAVIAGELHYPVNLLEDNQCVELQLRTSDLTVIVVSFHGVGNAFRGILAATVFMLAQGGIPGPLCDQFFQINYEEELEEARARFDPWLEESVREGLNIWQRSLI